MAGAFQLEPVRDYLVRLEAHVVIELHEGGRELAVVHVHPTVFCIVTVVDDKTDFLLTVLECAERNHKGERTGAAIEDILTGGNPVVINQFSVIFTLDECRDLDVRNTQGLVHSSVVLDIEVDRYRNLESAILVVDIALTGHTVHEVVLQEINVLFGVGLSVSIRSLLMGVVQRSFAVLQNRIHLGLRFCFRTGCLEVLRANHHRCGFRSVHGFAAVEVAVVVALEDTGAIGPQNGILVLCGNTLEVSDLIGRGRLGSVKDRVGGVVVHFPGRVVVMPDVEVVEHLCHVIPGNGRVEIFAGDLGVVQEQKGLRGRQSPVRVIPEFIGR